MGFRYRGRDRYSRFERLYEVLRLGATEGPAGPVAAGGNGGQPWRLDVPESRSVISTQDAAEILGVTVRAVTAAIEAGRLPATRVGRTWVLFELDVRTHAAAAGDGDGSGGGLVGSTWSASEAAGGIYATGERARALTDIEAAERDRVVRFAKLAHEMGVADHWVSVAREVGGKVSQMLDGLWDDLDLTADQVVVPARLRALRAGPDGDDDGDAA